MEQLPEELISHIFKFLSVPERKEASLVSKSWYSASLHPKLQKDLIVRCKPGEKDYLLQLNLFRRKLTHLEFGSGSSQKISEKALVSLLKECTSLELLDLSGCNSLFISGRLLSKDSDVKILRENLSRIRVLKLSHLRHMTDVTFERLVSVMENLEQISLSAVHMIFGNNLYAVNHCSPAMLHFTTFLKFVYGRTDKLKSIDLSYTALNDDALGVLAKISNLSLDVVSLKGCSQMSDKGLKLLVGQQHALKCLDVSECKGIGNDKDLFRILANNLPHLHTLMMRNCAKVGQCDVTALSGIGSLRNLDMGEVLRLFDRDLVKGLCCQGQRLTSLYMPSCPDIGDEFIIELCKSSTNLIDLDLSSCIRLTDASLHAITRNLTSLQTLRLSRCRELSDIGVLGYIPDKGIVPRFTFDFDHEGCPCCRERDSTVFRKPGNIRDHRSCVARAYISLQNGEPMFMLSNLKSLLVLDLSFCPRITNFGITEAVRFKDLRSLAVSGLPKLNDSAVTAIAQHNPSLEEVRITSNTMVTDVGVYELVSHCLQLNILDLNQCPALTDVCLKIIAASCKKISRLDISFNNLSMKAVGGLQSQLPKTKVVFKPHFD
ncbi:unnamed protein product [Candidula unifasciata]|uniref:F-box domain-containing protein n=1 Tax=Candidula unifasciata TaxID=100452 RepID=A0A8S3Z7C4_9EUPU|nr:unnamed protein product [Candidula unifasciata]